VCGRAGGPAYSSAVIPSRLRSFVIRQPEAVAGEIEVKRSAESYPRRTGTGSGAQPGTSSGGEGGWLWLASADEFEETTLVCEAPWLISPAQRRVRAEIKEKPGCSVFWPHALVYPCTFVSSRSGTRSRWKRAARVLPPTENRIEHRETKDRRSAADRGFLRSHRVPGREG
jgi:hypothetical protein